MKVKYGLRCKRVGNANTAIAASQTTRQSHRSDPISLRHSLAGNVTPSCLRQAHPLSLACTHSYRHKPKILSFAHTFCVAVLKHRHHRAGTTPHSRHVCMNKSAAFRIHNPRSEYYISISPALALPVALKCRAPWMCSLHGCIRIT